MCDLKISKTISLNPQATMDSSDHPFTRTCVLGCQANKSELCRFPVHDEKRCNNWLRRFGVSDALVEQLGLQKLRICFRHFSQHKEMAKTRIKMTPMRVGKVTAVAATATPSAALPSSTTAKPIVESTTTELIDSCSLAKKLKLPKKLPEQPQRSHSISSSASSDVQSICSDYESNLPISTMLPENGLNQHANKKRKLYLITEKKGEANGKDDPEQPQKRKMFVVVEEEQDGTTNKKLVFVADKPKANLTKNLEKFLPEILNCMQDKQGKQQVPQNAVTTSQVAVDANSNGAGATNVKPHITLPPKKNPTNFIKTKSTAGEPVMPKPMPLPIAYNNGDDAAVGVAANEAAQKQQETQNGETNINLSPDFRFLMKILPKLEQLPEPHKQNVKRSIQIFVEKSHSIYGKKE